MTLTNEITVPVSEWNVSGGRIPLGYVGDSNVEKVIFSFDDDLPSAVYTIEIRSRRLTGIELLTVEDKALVFNVSADILVHSGSVDLQIVATAEGKTIRHTNIFAGYVYGSIQADGKVPEAEISLFQQALLEYNSKLQQAITAAETAQTSANESAESAQQAQTSAENAQLSAQLADTYQTLANTAVVHASEYAGRAEDAAEAAEQSADKSMQAVADAGEYAAIAKDHMVAAEVAKAEAVQQALIAKDKAEDSIIAASKSKTYADQTEADAQQAAEARDEAKLYEKTTEGIRDETTLFYENTVKFASEAQQSALSASQSAELAQQSVDRSAGNALDAMGYATEAAASAALAESAAEGIVVDYDEVKTGIENLENKKVGYSEVSGNQLLMYADSTKSTLLAAMDLPAASVQDVQVAGESIVGENGIANVPQEIFWCTYGVTTYQEAITAIDSGKIPFCFFDSRIYIYFRKTETSVTLSTPSDESIRSVYVTNKNVWKTYTQSLLKNNDDTKKSIVKAGLTNGGNWTAEQQLAARQLIGVDTEWTLVGAITTDNKSDRLYVDLSGLSELFVAGTVEGTSACRLTNNLTSYFVELLNSSQTYKKFKASIKDTPTGYAFIFGVYNNANASYSTQNLQTYSRLDGRTMKDITYFALNVPDAITSCNIMLYAR